MGVLLIYLVVVLAHIFYLPSITTAIESAHVKNRSEKVQPVNHLERTDKAIFKEDIKGKTGGPQLIFLVLLFVAPAAKKLNENAFPLNTHSFCSQRYAYLSFCVFRI